MAVGWCWYSGDGGSGIGVVGSGDGGSGGIGVVGSGDGGSGSGGSGGPTFTPAIGVLDTSFNSPNGSIIQPISSSDDYGYSLAILPDGKILLGGSCGYEDNWDFCIARFDSNGTLDTSFGTRRYSNTTHRFIFLIMDILLQSNPMEKFYSVVLAIMEAITIFASLVLILMALWILLLEEVV
jgi:hypothetical protein